MSFTSHRVCCVIHASQSIHYGFGSKAAGNGFEGWGMLFDIDLLWLQVFVSRRHVGHESNGSQRAASSRSCTGMLMGSKLGCFEGCDVRRDAVPGHVTVLPSRSVRDVCVCTGRGRMATVYGPIMAFAWPYFAEVWGQSDDCLVMQNVTYVTCNYMSPRMFHVKCARGIDKPSPFYPQVTAECVE